MAKILSVILQEEVRYLPIQTEIFEEKIYKSDKKIAKAGCDMFPCTLQSHTRDSDDLKVLLGREPTSFVCWVTTKLGISRDEQKNLNELLNRGGIELLIQKYLQGNELQMEIDSSDLILGEQIGSGAHGVVYKALFQGMPTAVKKFNNVYANKLQDFVQEASLGCLLRHPNLVTAVGACTKLPDLCIVFELMPRGSLDQLLVQDSTQLTLPLQIRLALDVARGLCFLHAAGVVHRDIKCSNLLVTQGMQIKITDFGTALPIRYTKDEQSLTGTPQYIAPEVFTDFQYTIASDMYAFGIVLWQLATRRSPWSSYPNLYMIVDAVLQGKRPPIEKENTLYPLITSCWDQLPSNRPSAHDVFAALGRLRIPWIPRSGYTTPNNTNRPDLMTKLLTKSGVSSASL